ncbi:MAG TPA: ParA family protein [Acidobacteriota bacterium]|nr:ParA family protein [Acidobacteriota bacterium]HMZ78776.1 ParA family protein [Acidobacteriota bacterium]HNC46437.1 ParA family protein [Acidobacteriota bacterium]HND17915.1 ParA family protein [Acidobacteriota bacterium]HNG95631.1 ParA family protein [Acidobacteriota bacterium]
MPKKIAVVSVKGGVGKTTTCINLAAYTAAMGVNVLLVDLDPQNGCLYGMGLEFRPGYSLKDAVLNGVHPGNALSSTNRPELNVLLNGFFETGEQLEAFQAAFEQDVYLLDTLLTALTQERDLTPDLILMDCPAGVGAITLNALVTADSVILPMQCEPLSLRTLPQMLRSVASVKSRYNPQLVVEGVLATMFDPRQEAKFGIAQQVWTDFPEDMVFETVIPRHDQLIESFAIGAPAIDISARSMGSQAYIQLGRELIMRLPEETG